MAIDLPQEKFGRRTHNRLSLTIGSVRSARASQVCKRFKRGRELQTLLAGRGDHRLNLQPLAVVFPNGMEVTPYASFLVRHMQDR